MFHNQGNLYNPSLPMFKRTSHSAENVIYRSGRTTSCTGPLTWLPATPFVSYLNRFRLLFVTNPTQPTIKPWSFICNPNCFLGTVPQLSDQSQGH